MARLDLLRRGDLAHDGLRVDALAGAAIRDGGLDALLRQHRAMELVGGQAILSIHIIYCLDPFSYPR